ncbi:IclR family transcriptional regulator [Jongsikchunia kroppenstedtii]|uniref:IclR family transcriptional regulator n=1 Tax=Jongsikchunia kroppenstedtii TaxID=1121721 RepID=UPI0003611815|nr:helix-turn-helix domain-containing protein [Jongsikchunia kroppenstedtii]
MTVNDSDQAALGRTSPPTARVVRILDFLSSTPDERFTLAELSRGCEISKPTCLGIVTELCAAGYVARDEATKTYVLGPAVIDVGLAAQRGHQAGPVVRDELVALSDRFGTICNASAVVGDKIVVLESVAPPGQEAPARVGQTFPFAPPVGILYLFWQSDSDLERWLAGDSVLPTDLDRDRLWELARGARARGFVIEGMRADQMRLHTILAGATAHRLPMDVRRLLGEMAAGLGDRLYFTGEPQELSSDDEIYLIATPSFDADGRQSAVITMYADRATVHHDPMFLGAELRAAADRITASVRGRDPFVSLRAGTSH